MAAPLSRVSIGNGAPVLQDGHGSGSPERLHGQIGVAGELRVA